MQFTYEADEPMKTVSLEVVWNNDFVVDDDYGITCKTSNFRSRNWQQLILALALDDDDDDDDDDCSANISVQ